MGELKLKISDDVERKFRVYALKKYGYKKGSLSMAAERMISETIKGESSKADRFLNSAGGWKDIDADALIRRIYKNRGVTREKVELE